MPTSHPDDNATQSVMLVANPRSGTLQRDPALLEQAVQALRSWRLEPQVHRLEPDRPVRKLVGEALAAGMRRFAVLGGDGTLSAVAGVLAGSDASLAILPGGTANNVARCMGVPADMEGAAALLRTGRLVAVDVGRARCAGAEAVFLELCMVGLISTLSAIGDEIRHGNPRRIGAFLRTLALTPPAAFTLSLDGGEPATHNAHLAVVTNMPATGLHFQVACPGCQRDGLLDVQMFADLNKPGLLRHLAGGVYLDKPEDPRITRQQARRVVIETEPAQPVSVDGDIIGYGKCEIEIWPGALQIYVP